MNDSWTFPDCCDVITRQLSEKKIAQAGKLHKTMLSFSPAMAKDELASSCHFDFLFYRNFPHILEMIFFSLDYESYKNCAEVSNEWKALLSSERYKSKGKSLFKREILKDEITLMSAANMGDIYCVRRLLATGMIDVNRFFDVDIIYDSDGQRCTLSGK